jgi:hypothetical protein
MQFYWFMLAVLSVWRISHLLSFEDGPWKILHRLREALGNGFWRSLFDCFYCLSLWVALPVALFVGETTRTKLLLWPALSGGAILLERITSKNVDRDSSRPAVYYEDSEEEPNHVLR